MRRYLALTFAACFALTAAPAYAQDSDKRGYGGPLYVGPNFEQGGQHAPPDYSKKPEKKRVTKEHAPRKPAATETKESDTVAPSGAEADAGTDAAADTADTAATDAGGCKRFDSTAGQTITVPCD